MKIYAIVNVPTRISYEEIKDIPYVKEFESDTEIDKIIEWAQLTLGTKADEGPGSNGDRISEKQALSLLKLTAYQS